MYKTSILPNLTKRKLKKKHASSYFAEKNLGRNGLIILQTSLVLCRLSVVYTLTHTQPRL